ncbi:MAG: hypothetical protein R3247_14710 [Rhodothermales bacterium]|nr:hypothetical protein [Rhodothermales bacterium]
MEHHIGPCLVLFGDPYQAVGAAGSLQYLGPTAGDVVVTPTLQVSLVHADQAAGPIDAYGVWESFIAEVPLTDEQKSLLAHYWPGIDEQANALGFEAGVFQIATQVLALIPQDEAADGIAAAHAWWLPNAICDQVGTFQFRRIQPGQNAENPRATRFANLKKSHLGVKPAAAVPANARAGIYGPPTDFFPSSETDLWNLPDLTAIDLY